jgi:hypothetical protein
VHIRTLLAVGVLVALALTVASALVTRDGVGVFEYVIGIAAVVVLLLGALRISRRALRSA